MAAAISHIFVLMLENRAFDHMLGFSGVTGVDAQTGAMRPIDGLTGAESNSFGGETYRVSRPAPPAMPADPGHEFTDVLLQLTGAKTYPAGGAYPAITNSGFVAAYAGAAQGQYGDILKAFDPAQLPVLNALAREFAVCDRWFASIPGPTFPNRFFACGASSGGLDHSPTTAELLTWESISGFAFPNGSIFDAVGTKGEWRIYAGDLFPMAAALKNVHHADVTDYRNFAADVADPNYPALYTWIEPNYGDVAAGTYRGGNSQHPMDGVAPGEALIKSVYEAIRASRHWEESLLIVTWDEHGGFYDHVAPPPATAPGDTQPGSKFNKYSFTFEQYGVRVPAVIVSPLIPKNTIDGRVYDHSSIPATVEAAFGLDALTARDAAANNVLPLLSLAAPRTDAPATLPAVQAPLMAARAPAPADLTGTVDSGNLPGVLLAAKKLDMELSPQSETHAILARVQAIQTRAQAQAYLQEVAAKARAAPNARR
jgi:phospholipase C